MNSGDGNSSGVEEHVPSISVDELNLNEKLSLLSGDSLWTLPGLPRVGIPSLTVSDGPHGVRKTVGEVLGSYPATCFPTASALACCWDETLLTEVGVALQEECVYYGVQVLLGPGMNLKRHPGGGRNFEYFSEDPLLSGRLATAYVQGVQASGKVAACVKHFAVNNQESHRFVVNVVCDERTVRELYYKGFEMVVKQPSPPATVMCAYNRLNGEFCSEHRELLTDVLRGEWGFKGVSMTDWGATNDRAKAIKAGMDLEMPGSHGAHFWDILNAVKSGSLSMTAIDESAQRMLDLVNKFGNDTNDNTNEYDGNSKMWHDHFNLAYKVAMNCCVLLKNDNGFLPLAAANVTKLAVIGDFAKDHPRYQGMGSSEVKSEKVISVYDELKRHIKDPDKILFAPGYHADDDHMENVNLELVREAVLAAKEADVVLLCVGLPDIMEAEGYDRNHLRLPAQHSALVDAVCNANQNVVVVLSNGGVVEIPWIDQPKAVLEGYLLGEAGGAAIVDLIFGVQSPCGKLAETFPERVEDVLADNFFPGNRDIVEYREGLMVGYRFFDTVSRSVRFPFGHGLSYTTFLYSDLTLAIIQDTEHAKTVKVSLKVQNTGSIAAKEVVQCYIHCSESSVFRPEQELKDFDKVHLNPGERKEMCFTLSNDAFSFYDVGLRTWIVETTDFEVRVGASSRDIRLNQSFKFQTGPDTASQLACVSYPPCKRDGSISDQVDKVTSARRFGGQKKIVLDVLLRTQGKAMVPMFHRNSMLKEVASSRWIGVGLLWIAYMAAIQEVEEGPAQRRQKRMMKEGVKNLPLRALVLFSKGYFSFDTLDACICLLNRQFLSALQGFGRGLYHFMRPKR